MNDEINESSAAPETRSAVLEVATEQPESGDLGTVVSHAPAAWRHAQVAPKAIVEAALLAAGQPLTLKQLAELFPGEDAPRTEELAAMLAELIDETRGRGLELVEVASGWRYQIRRAVYPALAPLWQERPPRYSRALLETLALVAYRQPITRGEIENVRGVSVSTQIIRTLEERDWIRVVGHRDLPGKPALYGTTRTFLDDLNIKALSELPPLAEIVELDEIEPELDLGEPGAAQPPARAANGDDDDPETENRTAGQDGEPQAAESESPAAAENSGAGETREDDDRCSAGQISGEDNATERSETAGDAGDDDLDGTAEKNAPQSNGDGEPGDEGPPRR